MPLNIQHTEIILYVHDQERSKNFYTSLFSCEADLHVTGMTEFVINDVCKIGLMPNNSIAKIIANKLPHPESGNGIPRCELYLLVEDIDPILHHAINIGATIISPPSDRDWGDKVFYLADPDGHVIAFAERIISRF